MRIDAYKKTTQQMLYTNTRPIISWVHDYYCSKFILERNH